MARESGDGSPQSEVGDGLPPAQRAPSMTMDIQPAQSDGRRRPAAADARWIVSERGGHWAIALRRESGESGIRLYETRSLADGWSMLEQHPAGFLVAELTHANAALLLERIAALERWLPQARVAVVAERALAQHEWPAREAGAVWFASSPRELRPIAAMAVRHMRLAPVPSVDLVQQIWNSLPWGRKSYAV